MSEERVNLAIIGVGLIGGSLGLCLKEKMGENIYITGLCRTKASMDNAVKLGAVDYADADIETVVKDADIVFLSPPVLQIVPMVEKILPYLKKGAILTDAGSTKQYIWQHLQKILPEDVYYIAGHPMTGREKSGVTAAQKDLFVGKAYVIVEDTGAPKEAHEKLMRVLRHTGANFTTMDIAKHDRCASVISHVPHVTAAALVTLLNRTGGDLDSCIRFSHIALSMPIVDSALFKQKDVYYLILGVKTVNDATVFELRKAGLEYAENFIINSPGELHLVENGDCIISKDAVMHLGEMEVGK